MPTSSSPQTLTLTRRQTEVLEVIRNHIENTGAPPTRAEIAKTLGFRSVNAAEDHLKALARKGAITLSPGTSRGIQLAREHGIGLPIVKSPSADGPIFEEKNFDGRMRIQNEFFSPKPDYLLQIQGISLSEAGIKDGDLLAVHCSDRAENGKIIIARVNNKVVVRRYFRNGDQIELKAENPDFPPIVLNANQPLVIEGIGVGVIRTNSL
ncbi:MAG: transcriptional repressor LexA [Candidatus Berkiellales bacterium]